MFGNKALKLQIKELEERVSLLEKEIIRKDKQITMMEKIMRLDHARRGAK